MDALHQLDSLAAAFDRMRQTHCDFVGCAEVWAADKRDDLKSKKMAHLKNEKDTREQHRQLSKSISENTLFLSEKKREDKTRITETEKEEVENASLDKKRANLELERETLLREINVLEANLNSRSAKLAHTVATRESLTAKTRAQREFYEQRLALTIHSVATDVLRFEYTHISNKNWDRVFSFVLDVSAGKAYKLKDLYPENSITNLDSLLEFLNTSRDFFRFLKEMRCGFLTPSVLLVGKGRRITALTLCKVDVDGPATRENIVLCGSEDGEIIMWDLNDGRALQANVGAFPGAITQLSLTSSGHFILCCGLSDCIVILDAASLDCVKVVKNLNGWSQSLGILSTGPQTPDHIFRGTTNGNVDAFLLDEANLELVKTGDLSFEGNDYGAVNTIQISPFSPHLIMAVKRRTCFILERVQSVIKIVCSIYCNMDQGKTSGWSGGRFLSSRTVILYTEHGIAHSYFIGPPHQVTCGVGNALTTGTASVLVSDGMNICSWFMGVNDLGAAEGGSASQFCAIASFKPTSPKIGSIMTVVPPSTSGEPSYLICFQGGSKNPAAVVWPFWTNLGLEAVNALSGGMFSKVLGVADGENSAMNGMLRPKNQFDTGKIYIVPITAPFFHSLQTHLHEHITASNNITVLANHTGPVTSLFQTDFRASGGKNYLISGGRDQTIQIWDLETCKNLASLVCHSRSVKYFATVPADSGMKGMKHGVISVAEDESVAVIDLDGLKSNYILTGHNHAVYALHWRSLEETLVVQCSNFEGTVYVWQLKTGHLDRIEEGETAADIISCCDCTLILGDYSQDYMNANTKQTFSAFPISAGFNRTPTMFILLVNLKRFINDVYGGQYSLTPPSTPPQTRKADLSPKRELHHHTSDQEKQDSPTKTLGVTNLFKTSSNRSRMGSHSNAAGSNTATPNRSPVLSKSNTATTLPVVALDASLSHHNVVSPKARVFGDKDLVRGILSAVMSWGLDPNLDSLCRNAFELCAPESDVVAVGNRGASGYISVPIPGTPALEWGLSPTMSASRMLQIVSLLKTMTLKKEYEKDVSKAISQLCSRPASSSFQLPSFAFLAKYWQDQISDVQQASRIIFSSTLSQLGSEEKVRVVEYWRSFLPSLAAPAKKPSKTNIRAAVIMGIIGCENSELLPTRLQKDVSESLEILLKEDVRSPQRMMAVELLSKGFKTWEAHVNAASVLRSIILTTGLQSPSSNNAGGTPSRGVDSAGSGGAPSQALVMASRHAVVQIATINPALFITTVTFDFVHSKLVAERIGGLKLLGMFIAKKPALLYSHVPRMLESMVKALDPNVPGMREAVQTIVTSNFAELVKNFPNVAFHHGSQKLAVGTMDGLTVVYDLKTATKGQVLEGHTKPVTAVAFSPDGKMSVTYSFEENSVRFWQLSSGFLNSLVGAFSVAGGGGSSPGSASKAGHMKSFREFTAGPKQHPNPAADFAVKFEWLGDRSVKLHSVDEVKLVFTSIRAIAVPRVISGSPTSGIQVEIDVSFDPESLETAETPRSFLVDFSHSRVGTAILPVTSEPNTLTISLYPEPEDGLAVLAMRSLISKFGAGDVVEITLLEFTANAGSDPNASDSLSNLQLAIPAFETKIVQQIIARMPLNPFYMTIPGTITLSNPFDCTVHVLRVKGRCLYSELAIGAVDAVFDGEGVEILGKGVVETPSITVSLIIGLEAVYSLMDSITTGHAIVSAETTVKVSFGGYIVEFDYNQATAP
ncbi:UNVERIFIED_CONTAM: hypothetical protein HDU68_002329, partial [Siphonaria sp. JEL0065]